MEKEISLEEVVLLYDESIKKIKEIDQSIQKTIEMINNIGKTEEETENESERKG